MSKMKIKGVIPPMITLFTATLGVAGLKYACDLLGYEGGYVRAPLLELKASEKEKLQEILAKAQLLPSPGQEFVK